MPEYPLHPDLDRDPLWEPASDYDDKMDAVEHGLLDPASVYCIHGTFVGTWDGPDYLCGACESGITAEEMEWMRQADARRQRRVAALAPRMTELLDQAAALTGDQAHEPTVRALAHRLGRMVRWGVVPAHPELEQPATTLYGALVADQAQADAYTDALGDPSLYR